MNLTFTEGMARFHSLHLTNMVQFNQDSVLYFIKAIKIKLLFELLLATICKI